MQQPMPGLYDYLDYRRFLKDRVADLRKKSQFSFRNFNRRAGFQSSSALKLVIDGKRNLAQPGIFKVVKGLKLPSAEARFFTHLVLMNQATSHEEKEFHFRELVAYRPFRKARELTALQYDCLSHWYYAAILEMIRLDSFRDDPEWVARHLNPPITVWEARRALTDLEQLKFIVRDGQGRLQRAEATFSTPDEVRSLTLVNFHRQMCDLAKQAVEKIRSDHREFSSVTIAVSEEGLKKVKSKIQEFKRELDSYLEADAGARKQVVQVNLQLFPLTKES